MRLKNSSGSELACNWYYRRIIRLHQIFYELSREALPANRQIISEFIEWPVCIVDDLCSGLREPDAWDGVDWDSYPVFKKFKDYIIEQEKRIEKVLRTITYNLDDEIALTLVTGGVRPEKVRISKVLSHGRVLTGEPLVDHALDVPSSAPCGTHPACRQNNGASRS